MNDDLTRLMRMNQKMNIESNNGNLNNEQFDIRKKRISILETYGERKENKEDGSIYYQVSPENIAEANKQLNDLMLMDTPINLIYITMDSLENYDISLDDIDALYFMIKDSEG